MPLLCAAPKNDFARFPLWVLLGLLLLLTAGPLPVRADPFLNQLQRATPARRVVLVLNYFDTCRAVIQRQPYAFRVLDAVDALGEKTRDDQLRRYGRYLRATYTKHQQTNARNAALFLAVGQQAEADGDPQIAAVCRHFAGQYFFLNEEYGKAFEHLLVANEGFRAVGYRRIPEISRYLYELAFNYYYFNEEQKTIDLLSEASRYPAFSANIAIQIPNTIGSAYSRIAQRSKEADFGKAEFWYQQVRQVAARHGDSLWVGIAYINLAGLYENQGKWAQALTALRIGYRLGLQFGHQRSQPHYAAMKLARVYLARQRLDSSGYFLREASALYQRRNQPAPAFGSVLNDEQYLRSYCDVARKYYRAMGDLPQAYRYADSLAALTSRITRRQNTEQLSLIEQKRLIQQHQTQVKAIEQERAAQQIWFGVVGLGLALVALLFFLLYRFVRVRRRQEALLNAEREKSLRLEKQLVEDELARANADLTLFMDNLREKNALIDAISAELNGLTQPGKARSESLHLREARQSLEVSSLLTNDDWAEFQRRFERVHPGFFAQLKSQFTDLSPAEERLLSLAKLRVNTRQMGRMLGISPDSIRKTKYRLRKKLGIDGHSPLNELLSEAPDDLVNF